MADTHSEAHACDTVRLHKELCLDWVKRKPYLAYDNALHLATTYGLNGTERFFPLPQLAAEIDQDNRFNDYIRHKHENR